MDGRTDHPTHVLAKQRINNAITIWNLDNEKFPVELQIVSSEDETFNQWSLLMVHLCEDSKHWYLRYVFPDSLLEYIGEPAALMGGASILRWEMGYMQIELEEKCRGTHPTT